MSTDLLITAWRIQDYAPGDGVSASAFLPDFDDSAWLPAVAPGDVHSTLLAAGRIDDPYYDRNEDSVAWIEEREWWYRTTFTPEGDMLEAADRLELDFEGLDTYATLWLNGEPLSSARNMFRAQVIDVTSKVRLGEVNTLAICFDRPLDHIEGFDLSHWWEPQSKSVRIAMRKAQYGYGWDWGPRLPTVGVWRAVTFRRYHEAALRSVHFATVERNETDNTAVVSVKVEASAFAAEASLVAKVTLRRNATVMARAFTLKPLPAATYSAPHASHSSPSGEGQGVRSPNLAHEEITHAATDYLLVENPDLWWTWDLGEPALYDLEVSLEVDNIARDSSTQQVGIRTIALDQSPDPDEPGTRFFRFVLNGVPIFVRGANWIPAHSFAGAIQPETYDTLIAAACFGNMNMLRVWGGGFYEHEAFYNATDRLGILVWQDFMFACAMYPENQAWFVDEVAAEARYQVRRLRSRASLALWCGNNENQDLHNGPNWANPNAYLPGQLYYNIILPDVVHALDGKTAYWPGSPFGGNNHNSQEDGDVHNWNAWHGNYFRRFGDVPRVNQGPDGVSYRRYGEDLGRFISEFGLHASPEIDSLRKAIPADQLYHHSPSMDHHNKDNPKNKGDNLMIQHTDLPDTLDEYIEYSMTAQAEGLKFAVEHYRRRKPHCSGTLIWQLNDCWPVLSWSLMDYYGVGKAGFWYVRRAFSPVLASFRQNEDKSVSLWITNDTLDRVTDLVTVALRTFGGETLARHEIEVDVAPNTSIEVLRDESVRALPDRFLSVHSVANSFPSNRLFFEEIKDQEFPEAEPVAAFEQTSANSLIVRLKSDAFAYFVHITGTPVGSVLSDNYIDLEPGVERQITILAPAPISDSDLQIVWSLRQR